MHWEERWAAPRIHGRAKRQVEKMYQEEKPSLAPLPLAAFRYFRQESRKVYDDGTIQVDNSYYGAAPAPLHTRVVVRIYDEEIEILDPQRMEIIRRHPKSKLILGICNGFQALVNLGLLPGFDGDYRSRRIAVT